MSISELEVRTGDSMAGPSDERPLTDEERKLVSRLMADPIAFPQTFKTWLVAFLEGSDLTLPMNSVLGLTSILSPGSGVAGIMGALPAGLIFPCASSTPPGGTLLCDGRSISKNTYPRLHKAIGYTWGGSGDNFNIPDIQGRMICGTGPTHGINENEGRAPSARGPRHHHYLDIWTDNGGYHGHGAWADGVGDHTHGVRVHQEQPETVQAGGGATVEGEGSGFNTATGGGGGHSHNIGVGGEGEHNHHLTGVTTGGGDQDTPSYVCIPYCINY